MTARLSYVASRIKRGRSTKAEVEARREALFAIIDEGKPMTVRQVFYQATIRGGARHRRVGNACEREVVDRHHALGIKAERYPLYADMKARVWKGEGPQAKAATALVTRL